MSAIVRRPASPLAPPVLAAAPGVAAVLSPASRAGGESGPARDLQVAMESAAEQEWDDYNKVIATVASR